MAAKRRGLGRGIEALIPQQAPVEGDVPKRSSQAFDVFFGGNEDPAVEQQAAASPVDVSALEVEAPAPAQSGEGLVPVPGASFTVVPIGDIRANTRQPRTVFDEDELAELSASIKEVGLRNRLWCVIHLRVMVTNSSWVSVVGGHPPRPA